MEMHQIRYFLAVSETSNFTRAAAACHVSQPSLTRAIQKLEGELGGPLFRRERGHTGLTALGQMMKPYLEETLASAETARQEAARFRKLERAPLTLGVMCTIGPPRLVPLVNRLATRVPGLEFKLREAHGRRIVELLLAGEVDAAMVGLPSYPDKVCAEPLYRERYVVAFPQGHRFEAMNAVPVAALDGEAYLRRLDCEYLDFFGEAAGTWSVRLDVRYQSEREDWIQAMVLAGMGCAVLPEYTSLFPALRTRVVIDPELSREVSLLTVRGRRHPPALDLLVRMAKAHDWNAAA
jgi:LysR family transcriptional regulator, hydrogen peroxide-inducible genes activator